jgi:glycosyltransferase involved in cell wall biosynthesis
VPSELLEPIESISGNRKPRLLFCSYHCYWDRSSGAALCTRELLELLAQRGWSCRVFCGPHLDFEQAPCLAQLLDAQHIPFDRRQTRAGAAAPLSVYHFQHGGVPIQIYDSPLARPFEAATREEGACFLALYERLLERYRPDLLLTYGGDWVAQEIVAQAKRRGIPVVFALHNFAYHGAELFRPVDAVLVPSRFAQVHYRRTLGLSCTPIPGPWDWTRVRCPEVKGRYVTFVNPQPDKGVFVFARIAAELARQRPDIPLLVVEGRGKADWLDRTGLDIAGLGNVFVMANTYDPRDFYQVSRMVLMPSLCWESLGRVAVESLINGIPVLGSRRGGLPETLEEAGFLFDVPERYTPQSRLVPTAAEVAPWVETIIRLWDDDAFHVQERRRCLAAAEAWCPERLLPRFEEFFAGVSGCVPTLR